MNIGMGKSKKSQTLFWKKIHEHPDKYITCLAINVEQKSAPSPSPRYVDAQELQTPSCSMHKKVNEEI